MIRFITSLTLFLVCLTGCGESGYILKPNLPEHIKKIVIPTFINKTLKYGIETDLTDTVIKEFLKDGRLEVVNSPAEADMIVEGTIKNYINEVIQYDANNVPIQYRLKIDVSLRLLDAKDQSKVLGAEDQIGGITGGTATYSVSGTTGFNIETEFDARRKIYEKLSGYIVNRTIYGWDKY